uniref:Guanylate cyclase domain-containing protein n=1 Tax=viral metagenome TaxID=1070528 RepID=A0A6C0HBY6_9ZZZZ
MNYLFIYLFIYSNIDAIINKYYLPMFHINFNTELISTNGTFYYSVTKYNEIMLFIYFCFVVSQFVYCKVINKYSLATAMIFIKYLSNSIMNPELKLYEYEFSRNVMWVFTTPLLLKMYCNTNNIKLTDINIHYHVFPTVLNVISYPFKGTNIYYATIIISYASFGLFMRTLYRKRDNMFTNIYILIWLLFAVVNCIDILQLKSVYDINIYYVSIDILGKMLTNILINDYYEREQFLKEQMDIQCVQFNSHLLESVREYSNNNSNITEKCQQYILYIKQKISSRMPENTDELKKELLTKLLPFNLDKEYIEQSSVFNKRSTIKLDMICILFTDIVNYTELAKKYDDKIIFQLLNNIYNNFDNIRKKYSKLQKIETIGDAYMVVGDIYRSANNHKAVIKEILLLAFELVKSVKQIKTPDDTPLSIRIGITMGNVSIGILGNEIPRLCVVGNAVNVASRLQSTADIDSIQISRHIYEKIGEIDFDIVFNCIFKENVFLKNLGTINTYNIYPLENGGGEERK